jgi:hypothetical protein
MALRNLDKFLRHPLLLVLATGLFTGFMIPRFTERWQEQQKAIDTRARFASEVTESVVKLLLSVQFAERKSIEQKQYDQAYRDWEVSRAILDTQLRGHFKDPQLAVDWGSLSEAVTKIYVLSGTVAPHRSQVINELRSYFSQEATEWELLERQEFKRKSEEDFQKYFKAWWSLREAALLRTGDFVKRILDSRTSSYG